MKKMPFKNPRVIPKGIYCYSRQVVERDCTGFPIFKLSLCPYWARKPDGEHQADGYCHFIEAGDGENDKDGVLVMHLWDHVKECGVNFDDEEDDL